MRENEHPFGQRASVVFAALAIMAMVSCSQMNDRGERDSHSATAASRSSPCSLSPEALTERMEGDLQQLADASREVLELSDGYTLRFGGEDATLRKVLDFVAFERGCCSFLQFEVKVEPSGGPVWLTLRGDGDAKTFLAAMMKDLRIDTRDKPAG